jgi:hypothetical protein
MLFSFESLMMLSIFVSVSLLSTAFPSSMEGGDERKNKGIAKVHTKALADKSRRKGTQKSGLPIERARILGRHTSRHGSLYPNTATDLGWYSVRPNRNFSQEGAETYFSSQAGDLASLAHNTNQSEDPNAFLEKFATQDWSDHSAPQNFNVPSPDEFQYQPYRDFNQASMAHASSYYDNNLQHPTLVKQNTDSTIPQLFTLPDVNLPCTDGYEHNFYFHPHTHAHMGQSSSHYSTLPQENIARDLGSGAGSSNYYFSHQLEDIFSSSSCFSHPNFHSYDARIAQLNRTNLQSQSQSSLGQAHITSSRAGAPYPHSSGVDSIHLMSNKDYDEDDEAQFDEAVTDLFFSWTDGNMLCWDHMDAAHKEKVVRIVSRETSNQGEYIRQQLAKVMTPSLALLFLSARKDYVRYAVNILYPHFYQLPNVQYWKEELKETEQQVLVDELSEISAQETHVIRNYLKTKKISAHIAYNLYHNAGEKEHLQFVLDANLWKERKLPRRDPNRVLPVTNPSDPKYEPWMEGTDYIEQDKVLRIVRNVYNLSHTEQARQILSLSRVKRQSALGVRILNLVKKKKGDEEVRSLIKKVTGFRKRW